MSLIKNYNWEDFDVKKNRSLAKGVVERIGEPGSCKDHRAAIAIIVDKLTDRRSGVIASKSQIDGIGHRVVHGGEEFNKSVLINDDVVASITKFVKLAPLHNPPALSGIKATRKLLATKPQVAVFDTAFHQTMPEEAFTYALPNKFYKKYD